MLFATQHSKESKLLNEESHANLLQQTQMPMQSVHTYPYRHTSIQTHIHKDTHPYRHTSTQTHTPMQTHTILELCQLIQNYSPLNIQHLSIETMNTIAKIKNLISKTGNTTEPSKNNIV